MKLMIKKIPGLKNILFRAGILIGFLHLWVYWTMMLMAFSDEPSTTRDYIWSFLFMLVPNIGILLGVFPFPKLIKWMAVLPIMLSSFLYVTIFWAAIPAWEFATIGLLTNLGAVFLVIKDNKGGLRCPALLCK